MARKPPTIPKIANKMVRTPNIMPKRPSNKEIIPKA